MKGQLDIPVPTRICHPLFYKPQDTIKVSQEMIQSFQLYPAFLFEAAFFSGIQALRPWENKQEFIPLLLEEWKEQKILLDKHFSNRNQKAAELPLKTALSLFLQLLFWTNGKPADLESEIQDLPIKPVNLLERLDFIFKRPVSYHAYIQLSELMAEMEKQYIKQQTLEKIKKKAPQ
ncbi:YpoC family protein [Bacillus sp. J33]|uniref:YpoC family protein n=1 Tax=Bacillus sp. J33 TaxID=935836 RepID=UPI00047D945A|nr:hypothetical protein [Bacillus sp. J33]